MKPLNRSHIKSRSIQKRASKPLSRPPQKASPLNDIVGVKEARKKSVNPVPTPSVSIGSLATSRETLILRPHRPFFANKKEMPTIRIEDGYSVERHLCDPKAYIKSTTHRNNGKQSEIMKKMTRYKSKIARLEKENLGLKKTLNTKESELKRKNTAKEKKTRKKIKEKLLHFAKSFNKALELVESMCAATQEEPEKATKRSESAHSASSSSSLVTVFDLNTLLERTSIFPSQSNSNAESSEINKVEKATKSSKKDEKKGKTTCRRIRAKALHKKN
eukprot:TRINITY_DN8037_c0_g1_i3.p1 TRINITY_DN8037_c0_g1~~TRINITY_DN8037_c0_g1_i3.p1  ORF type:complete len:275 (+),score=55.43 TRINITY_DN8037_c0_g1_i3:136-960(+)